MNTRWKNCWGALFLMFSVTADFQSFGYAEESPAPPTQAEEAPDESNTPVEVPTETGDIPELLSANDELILFFPGIKVGDTLEQVVRNFVKENYMNVLLTFVGKATELAEEFKDNLHFAYCEKEKSEALLITSIVNKNKNYVILVFGKEGKVESYSFFDPEGSIKVPEDYPTLSNLPENILNTPEFESFAVDIKDCGFEEE